MSQSQGQGQTCSSVKNVALSKKSERKIRYDKFLCQGHKDKGQDQTCNHKENCYFA